MESKNYNKVIRIASLFAGIGGFEEGIKYSKMKYDVVFASEIDKNAKISYLSNFTNNNLYGDITQIDEKNIPDHDLLIGGFPCQSFSIAGSMKGFSDVRGTLFFDIVRILKEKKPKYFLLENVKNLISHDNGNTIRVIIDKLNKLGYTIDFSIIDSKDSGLPQSRNRTYIIGIYNKKPELFQEDRHSMKVTKLKKVYNVNGLQSFNFFNYLVFNNEKKSLIDILETKVNEKFYFNSEKVIKYLNINKFIDLKNKKHEIVKLFDLPREIHNDLERQRRVYSIYGISPTVLARSDSTKIYLNKNNNYRLRKITPEENFYVQGFSKTFVDNIKKTGMTECQMYKQSGNAVSPPVITGIINLLYEKYIYKE